MSRILTPWRTTFSKIDQILRGRPAARSWHLWGILAAAGCGYGAVLGSFGAEGGPRVIQMIFSAVKVPLLLVFAFWLSLPSFFILNSLLGLRADFRECMEALANSQAVLGLILASLAPVTELWYLSVPVYSDAILFNAGMFVIASGAAQWSLRRAYRPLILRDQRHGWMLRVWLLVYAFVGIQTGWVLRPFIGDPARATTFFRQDAFTNSYMFVGHLILGKF